MASLLNRYSILSVKTMLGREKVGDTCPWFYLIASIVEPFILVKSNQVAYPREISDSLIRCTDA